MTNPLITLFFAGISRFDKTMSLVPHKKNRSFLRRLALFYIATMSEEDIPDDADEIYDALLATGAPPPPTAMIEVIDQSIDYLTNMRDRIANQ